MVKFAKESITIEVKLTRLREFKIRMWIALKLIKLACLITNMSLTLNEVDK